jgi:hypothetical protein
MDLDARIDADEMERGDQEEERRGSQRCTTAHSTENGKTAYVCTREKKQHTKVHEAKINKH